MSRYGLAVPVAASHRGKKKQLCYSLPNPSSELRSLASNGSHQTVAILSEACIVETRWPLEEKLGV